MKMLFGNIAQSLKGTCRYCNQKTSMLQRDHPNCRHAHASGYQEMVHLARQAASAHTFNQDALRQTLRAIAQRP